MNIKKKLIVIASTIAALSLSSCSLLKCEAEGLVILRDVSNYPSYKHSKSITEIVEVIKSADTINEVKDNLSKNAISKNANYRDYLSDKNFAKYFKIKIIEGTDILSFSYKHRDSNFANEVVNNWMNAAFIKTKKTYTPEIYNLKSKYEKIAKAVSSKKIIDTAFDYFNKTDDSNSKSYMSKEDFASDFKIEKNINSHVINVTYKHSDIEISSKVMEAWFLAMHYSINSVVIIGGDNYSDFEDFGFKKNTIYGKLKSVQIGIKDKLVDYIKIIELADNNCDLPILNNIRFPLKIFKK